MNEVILKRQGPETKFKNSQREGKEKTIPKNSMEMMM